MKHIISLGAGVQSSTMALMAAYGEIEPMPDCAIFADTQAEPKAVYGWLDWLETRLPFPVHRVTQGDLWTDSLMVKHSKKSGRDYVKGIIPYWVKKQDGTRGAAIRQCTGDYKLAPIYRKAKALADIGARLPAAPVIEMWIGVSTDEAIRMKPSPKPWVSNRWPLIESGMTRNDCLRWMERNSYPLPPRSACVFCPYHSAYEWDRLKREEPEEFERATQYERQMRYALKHYGQLIGEPFLWDGLVDLKSADFLNAAAGQQDLFGNECEGMCGV